MSDERGGSNSLAASLHERQQRQNALGEAVALRNMLLVEGYAPLGGGGRS